MKHPEHLQLRSLLLACCLAAAYPAAHAEETSTTSTTTATTSSSTTTTAIGTSATTEAKLSAEFAEFLGSEEQASAVVSGLRQGTAFSLDALVPTPVDSTTTSGTTGTATTTTITAIDPPTGTMGYGNVRITLRLAEAQLNQMGITQPTTEELAAVLIGGEINGTQVDGILTLRADGMGWGQIAKEYGMTVGQLMGKGGGLTKPAPTPYAQTKAGQVSGASVPSGKAAHANGYIPSSPKTMPASSARSNGYIPSGGGKATGSGIVSAAGGSMGGSAHGGGKGQANKITTSTQGAGAVSAGGQHVSMSGVSNAGGGSKAMAPGQAKKN